MTCERIVWLRVKRVGSLDVEGVAVSMLGVFEGVVVEVQGGLVTCKRLVGRSGVLAATQGAVR